MANEITVRAGLQVRKGFLYSPVRLPSFQDDQSGAGGPAPGQFNVSRFGTNLDLSELGTPGWAFVQNLSNTYSVEWGGWDGTVFIPIGELLPGQGHPIRLSPNLGERYDDTGTATTAGIYSIRFKADFDSGADGVDVLVEAYER